MNNNKKIPAIHFVSTIMANVDNEKMSDSAFRNLVKSTLPIVEKQPLETIRKDLRKKEIKFYIR